MIPQTIRSLYMQEVYRTMLTSTTDDATIKRIIRDSPTLPEYDVYQRREYYYRVHWDKRTRKLNLGLCVLELVCPNTTLIPRFSDVTMLTAPMGMTLDLNAAEERLRPRYSTTVRTPGVTLLTEPGERGPVTVMPRVV